MEELILKLPKRILIELLGQIPQKELEELIQESIEKSKLEAVRITPQSLDKLNGIISIGGDALQDTETLTSSSIQISFWA